MGLCTYCGKPAGLLRRSHKHCRQRHAKGVAKFRELVVDAVEHRLDSNVLESALRDVQSQHMISDSEVRGLLASGWKVAVERAFDDGLLSEDEERGLSAVLEKFGLSQAELDDTGEFTRVVKGGILRDLLNGVVPERVETSGPLPFNFQKTETLLWVFSDVDYYEDKVRRHRVGSAQGVSIRIAKGVYYRTGGFRGHTVERTETVHMGTGLLAVTNKHLYFGGAETKTFRIRLDKIVSFEPYSDGIGIQRDAATAKPQSFVTRDGWFTYNLVQNAANL